MYVEGECSKIKCLVTEHFGYALVFVQGYPGFCANCLAGLGDYRIRGSCV